MAKKKSIRPNKFDALNRANSLLVRSIPLVSSVRWAYQDWPEASREANVSMVLRRAEEGLKEAHEIMRQLEAEVLS